VKYLLHCLALVSRLAWLLMKLGLLARVFREAACGRHLKQLLVPSALVPGVNCDGCEALL
jgi:flagellar biogenesis protein FliO